jgi:hypothetical protein
MVKEYWALVNVASSKNDLYTVKHIYGGFNLFSASNTWKLLCKKDE